jgi:hypothetical protein
MSSRVWPPVPRKLLPRRHFSYSAACRFIMKTSHLLPATWNQQGFVSILNAAPPPIAAFRIIARGNGCCGSVTPTGSSGPGTMCTGKPAERISVSNASKVAVGWALYDDES